MLASQKISVQRVCRWFLELSATQNWELFLLLALLQSQIDPAKSTPVFYLLTVLCDLQNVNNVTDYYGCHYRHKKWYI